LTDSIQLYVEASIYAYDLSTGGVSTGGATFTVNGGGTPIASTNYKWLTTAADRSWLLINTNAGSQGYSGGYAYLDYFDSRWFLRVAPAGALIGIPGGPGGTIRYTNVATNAIVLE